MKKLFNKLLSALVALSILCAVGGYIPEPDPDPGDDPAPVSDPGDDGADGGTDPSCDGDYVPFLG